jgi:hypothetical protein
VQMSNSSAHPSVPMARAAPAQRCSTARPCAGAGRRPPAAPPAGPVPAALTETDRAWCSSRRSRKT